MKAAAINGNVVLRPRRELPAQIASIEIIVNMLVAKMDF
jgi:hypothetical protein